MGARGCAGAAWQSWFLVGVVLVVSGWLAYGRVRTAEHVGFWLFSVAIALKDAWDKKLPYCMLLGAPNFVCFWAAPRCMKLAVHLYTTAAGLVAACRERVAAGFATRIE